MIYLEQLDGSNVDIFQPFIPESLQVQALSDDGFTFLGMEECQNGMVFTKAQLSFRERLPEK